MLVKAIEREKAAIREKAREEGREEGREERALSIARTMLAQSFPVEQVAALTELPLEKVIQLRDTTG